MRRAWRQMAKRQDLQEESRFARTSIRFGVLLTLAVWAGCNQIAGIYEGEPRACSTVADCDLRSAECRTVECMANECVYIDTPAGPLNGVQITGDCQEVQCDGEGKLKTILVETDSDDGNPCTKDSCVGSMSVHEILPFIDCYTGPQTTRGQGICHDGRQACDANGNLVGSCIGERRPEPNETCLTIYDDDCDGEINEASGTGCICEKDTLRECYGSTVGSLDVGPCVSGYQKCLDGLYYGPCELQNTPKPESCTTPIDDDCDGLINESGTDCVCGDGIVSTGEECDDANTTDGDGCTASCQFSMCGNGAIDGAEECDDGNEVDTDGCLQSCKKAICGDGFVQMGVEACDDGNLVDSDGCTSACVFTSCGNGQINPEFGEICDDGNLTGGDGCQEDCTPSPISMGLGFAHTCAIFFGGSLKCWGVNWSGELGLGDTAHRGDQPNEMGANLPTVNLGTNRTAKQVVAGDGHTCALLDDQSVKCWGNNDYGQLGLDSLNYYGVAPGTMGDGLPVVNLGENVKQLAAGRSHTCAILESGNVKCWGENTNGKLGIGSTATWGNKSGDMAALPIVPLTPGSKATSISLGAEHTCVVEDNSVVRCWGRGSVGQLAQGDMINLGDTQATAGGALVNLGPNRTPIAVALGGASISSCAYLTGGGFACWGGNQSCQLGLGHYNDIGDQMSEIGANIPDLNGGVNKKVIAAGFGERHLCALLSGSIVRCWGSDDVGQIGGMTACTIIGDARPPIDLGPGFIAANLYVGGGFNCAVSSSGRIKCWGWNEAGQLGLGDVNARGLATAEMGNALPIVRPW